MTTITPDVAEARSSARNTGLALVTGATLVLLFLAILVPTMVLAPADVFNFPDVLRGGAAEALALLNANRGTIVPMYYVFVWSSILTSVVAVLLHDLLRAGRANSTLLNMALLFGVGTGINQYLGFSRWLAMKPALAERYFDPATSASGREAAELLFHAFNEYAGIGIGEHLGWVFNGVWIALLGLYMVRARVFGGWSPWVGWMGVVTGVLTLVSTAEQFGYDNLLTETAFFVGYGGFMTWLLVLAAAVVFARRAAA